MRKALLLITILSTAILMAQAPAIQWKKAFGGTQWDQAMAIQQTTDGGYVVVGYTLSEDGDVSGYHGFQDILVIKLSSSGSMEWQKCIGGTKQEWGCSIKQTNDGGYILAGYTQSSDVDVTGFHGDFSPDAWVVKLTSTGAIEWQKALGGTAEDYAYSVQQTSDDGYIVAGSTHSNDGDVIGNNGWWDAWVIKLSVSGTIEWQKPLGGTTTDEAYCVQQTADGGYIVAGYTKSNDGEVTGNHGNSDAWVVKLTDSGAIQWQKTYGGSSEEEAHSIQQTADGGYVLAGLGSSTDGDLTENHGDRDFLIIKISDIGDLQWQKTLGGSSYEKANSIQQTANGEYIVSGITLSSNGDVSGNHGINYDAWIVKLSGLGVFKWQRSLGGTGYEEAQCIQQTADGGYIMAGHTTSNSGDATGSGYHGGTGNDFWVVKLASDELATATFNDEAFKVFPNPAKQSLNIQNLNNLSIKKITITDLTGKIVMEQSDNLSQINVQSLERGTYFIQIQSEGKITTQKFIKE